MKVLGCIGAGTFGKVYKVEIDGFLFALKKISLSFDCEDDGQDLQSAKKEAQILQDCLYHPNIVQYYLSYRQGDYYYIAMEFVSGRPLNDLDLPFQDQKLIVAFIIQMLLSLRFLRRLKIIHRDLKPSNIMVSQNGLFKILDFGIGKKLIRQNNTNSCLGTPYYTAPQILSEEKYNQRVDLWSFGVILYQISHGKLPFVGFTMDQLKFKIQKEHPKLKKQLHHDLKLAIRGCLAKNPVNRLEIDYILNLPLIRSQFEEWVQSNGRK